jgi:DnaJ-class molecular chaperone
LFEKIENDIHKDAVTERDLTHAVDLCLECECTLEEFYFGSTKTIEIKREVKTGPDSSETVTATREIEIKPGMACGTKLHFPKEGHKPSNKLVGDLIVTLKETCHSKYRRCGNDIVYMHKMSLADALTTAPFEFTTLEGELFKITPDEIVNPETTKCFAGKGMPILNNDPLSPLVALKTRGNFILKFDICFP